MCLGGGMRAIRATSPGGADVLELIEVPDPVPGPGEILVDVAAAGVNFIDIYQRSGVYPMDYPHPLGLEGAGTIREVGAAVSDPTLVVGAHVAWASAPGSYASAVVVPEAAALVVPEGIDLVTAAAVPLQGMTAHYLTTSAFPIHAGDDVLVHAGAGGVGLLLTQLAVARGARVISTVSTPEKESLARVAGASEVIRYDELDDLDTEIPVLVREFTGGRGVQVVYDGVGRTTFEASLASLAPRGMLVLFGGASGQVPPFDLQRLNAAGSLFVTRPTLAHYTASMEETRGRAGELFAAMLAGTLNVRVGATFPLAEAGAAHTALAGRETTGKVLLIP